MYAIHIFPTTDLAHFQSFMKMEKLHAMMYRLVIHPSSNKFIGNFQRICGVKPTDESYKQTFLYWYFR